MTLNPSSTWRRRRSARRIGVIGLAIVLVGVFARYALAGGSSRLTLVLTAVIATALVARLTRRDENASLPEFDDAVRTAREAAEAERARVVRDLHDGAQQRLVHTVIALKRARRTSRNGGNAEVLMAEALAHAEQAIRELRDLAHGIVPRSVTQGGLRAGVESLAAPVPLPVTVEVATGRLVPAIESAAYFVIAEALTNVVKHADATSAEVRAFVARDALRIEIRDDGGGGVRRDGGAGLRGMRDRVESLGGRLRVESPEAGGTLIAVRLPLHISEDCSRSLRSAPGPVVPEHWRARFVTRKDPL